MSDDQPQEVVTKPPLSSEELERLKATPGFQKAMELIRHLDEYYDFSSSFMVDFPNNLPKKFPLKLGKKIIGVALIDWKAVGGHLFTVTLGLTKPPELSDDEYVRQLEQYFKSLDPKDVSEMMLPAFSTMWHMMEFLPQKLRDAIVHLAVEGRQKDVIRRQRELGAEISSPAKFADKIAKMERDAIKKRLPKKQPTKTKPAWQSESNLRHYAEKVVARQLLCQCMKNVYERCDFLEDWADDLRHDEQFKLLSPDVPQRAISWAIRQIGDDKVSPRDKETLLIACEIARQELDLPFQEIQTLRGYYLEGTKFVKADRNKRKVFAANNLPSAPPTGELDSAEPAPPTSDID